MVTACAAPPEKTLDDQLARQLQVVLEDAVESPETPFLGALLYVTSPELGTWSNATGLGNIEPDTAMRADDIYPACSIVKIWASVVILQLVEEGQFSLDDPITALLPESVTARFADSDQITVRMLLGHTSGLGNWQDPIYGEAIADPTRVWGTDEILDLAAAQDPSFAPGKGWQYSNNGYFLLHLIIEQATGRSWREEARERVVEPLNLENTALPEPGDTSYPGDYFHSYFFYEGEAIDLSYTDASVGNELVSTSADLARFLDAVMAGELFQNPETLDEMLTFRSVADIPFDTVPLSGIVGYGLGMMKFVFPGGIEMFGHTGDMPNSTFVFYLPAQDITISGAANVMDPVGLYHQIVLPTLEILIPEFEMPSRGYGEQ
jgi:D-alanyl-D-alanine carboxypeptidase